MLGHQCCHGLRIDSLVRMFSRVDKTERHTAEVQRMLTRRTWLTGVAKVESMQTVAPAAWHRRAMRRTSTQRRYGLVGDSEKNSVTSQSCSVASSRSRSDGSITCTEQRMGSHQESEELERATQGDADLCDMQARQSAALAAQRLCTGVKSLGAIGYIESSWPQIHANRCVAGRMNTNIMQEQMWQQRELIRKQIESWS